MTIRECGAVVKFMLAGFPAQRARMTEEDVEAMTAFYFAGLQDLDVEPVKAAIGRLGRTAKFLPVVAEIREAVGVVHHGEQSPAIVAWGEVHGFMRSKGYMRQPGVDFAISDPIAREVVCSLGWEDMCSASTDHIRARFLDGYALAAKLARKVAAASDGGKNPALGPPRGMIGIGYGGRVEREEQPRTLGQLIAGIKTTEEE